MFRLFSVSVGGATGLLLGASVLSFVELIFFFTVRFISNIIMENRKRNNFSSVDVPPMTEVSRINTAALETTNSRSNYENGLKMAYFKSVIQNIEKSRI